MDQRADLDRQISRMMGWVGEQRLVVDRVMTGLGSGLNGQRPKLTRLLADPQVATIVGEYRTRLARFGIERLRAALPGHRRRLLVADPAGTTNDVVRDMVEVLTSLCARLSGPCGACNRAPRVLTATRRGG